MGKTEKGALWLDAEKTSPYEFYQYWRNIDDADVKTVLSLLTFLPMEKVEELSNLKDEKINEAKKVAAYEITKLIHGEEAAKKAEQPPGYVYTCLYSTSFQLYLITKGPFLQFMKFIYEL